MDDPLAEWEAQRLELLEGLDEPPPVPPAPPATGCAVWVGCLCLAAAVVVLAWYWRQPAPTFPAAFHPYTDSEARLARHVQARTITRGEIRQGVLLSGVVLADMERAMRATVERDPDLVVIPLYYAPEHAYAAVAAANADGAHVLLNPVIHAHSGLATVRQTPRFCPHEKVYQLPTHVVVTASPWNSTGSVRTTFTGVGAGLLYTIVQQLGGVDVCA